MTRLSRTDGPLPAGKQPYAESNGRQSQAHEPGVVEAIRSRWDEPLADALIQIALASVSRAYDELAPGCPVDGPGWDEAEALVEAALAMHNVAALRDSLAGYEQHARGCFGAWGRGTTSGDSDGGAPVNV